MTVAFLGAVEAERVAVVWEAARGCVDGGVGLRPGGVAGVPRRRPRLIALELTDEDGSAAALAGRVASALSDAGLYEPERRPFWPHVTVARARRGARVEVPASPGPALEPFAAPALTLYRSDTLLLGARYTALERVDLGR